MGHIKLRLPILAFLMSIASLIALLVFSEPSAPKVADTQAVAEAPQARLPLPQGTEYPPRPPPPLSPTATEQPPEPIPTPYPLQPAIPISHTISAAATGWQPELKLIAQIGRAELAERMKLTGYDPIWDISWAPTGDKLLLLTQSGKLFWSNLDGAQVGLINDYGGQLYERLGQQPFGNTLLVPGYAIHFTEGQAPVVKEAPDAWLPQLHWWSSKYASGIANNGCEVCQALDTLDADGIRRTRRNVPYMASGAVQPGGEWLAYTTTGPPFSDPFIGSDKGTVYLLNLNTGERLQVTEPEKGNSVESWSPNGKWFFMEAHIGVEPYYYNHGVLASADGKEWIIVTPSGGANDPVWSPDSKYLAFSNIVGSMDHGCGTSSVPPCEMSSETYIVDIENRRMTSVESFRRALDIPDALVMRPAWSPDGTQLALLSFDPEYWEEDAVRPAQAYYLVSVGK